jgi:hypothetical protein
VPRDVGAAEPHPPRTPPPPRTCGGPAPDAGVATIRDVDWCNRTYADPIGDTAVFGGHHEDHVYTCGIGEEPLAGRHVTEIWTVDAVAYGDLDGDGIEDAAVSIDELWFGCLDGDTDDTRVTRVRAFTVRDGAVVPLGDDTINRVDDRQLAWAELVIDGGEVVRTYFWVTGTACVDRWRIAGGALSQIGPHCT